MYPYGVYVKTDGVYITAVDSDFHLGDVTGWTKIDSGWGIRFLHAQNNYFPEPLVTRGGAYRYKLIGGILYGCTDQEIADQERSRQPDDLPSLWDDLQNAYQEGVDSV